MNILEYFLVVSTNSNFESWTCKIGFDLLRWTGFDTVEKETAEMIQVIATIELKTGCREDFLPRLNENVPRVKAEDGSLDKFTHFLNSDEQILIGQSR